jgi:hypothetical protein
MCLIPSCCLEDRGDVSPKRQFFEMKEGKHGFAVIMAALERSWTTSVV